MDPLTLRGTAPITGVMSLVRRTLGVMRAETGAVAAIATLTGGAATVLVLLNGAATQLLWPGVPSAGRTSLASAVVVVVSAALFVCEQTSLTILTKAHEGGESLSTERVFLAGLDVVPAALWARLVQGVLLVPLYLVLVVPGMLMTVRWCFATQICAVEFESGLGALRASNRRVRGRSWDVFTRLFGFWTLQVACVLGGLLTGLRFMGRVAGPAAFTGSIAGAVTALISLVATTAAVAFYSIWRAELYLAVGRNPESR